MSERKPQPGDLVMSTDPGDKLVDSSPAHGPWCFRRITKGGLAEIERVSDGEVRFVARRHLRAPFAEEVQS